MRRNAMETLRSVNEWVDRARGLLAKQVQLPLIDNTDIDMHSELWYALEHGDDALRAAVDNILSRDLDDIAARYVALNAYYRLMVAEIPEELRYADGFDQFNRDRIAGHLGYLVRLRDPGTCADLISIRWEIVNAFVVKDHTRVFALCDQLTSLVPDGERHYLRGRVHFLMAVLHTWDIEESLEHWDLPIGAKPDGLRGLWQWLNGSILTSAAIMKFPTREEITDNDQDNLRDATKFLEKAIGSGWDCPATARFMLARSYASTGDHHNAARQYRWLVEHQDVVRRSCEREEGPLWDSGDFKETIRSGIYSCLVNSYDDAGEISKSIAAALEWIEACPDQLGTYERIARLELKRADPVTAAEYMRKEADRNETLGEDPNVSIILALGGIISTARLDETLKNIASSHPHEHAVVESLIRNIGPASPLSVLMINNDGSPGLGSCRPTHPKERVLPSTALRV
jgi:tetratricopeptide (TPR) repeat protein